MDRIRTWGITLINLIENMRREGYELQVSRPEVIIKEIDGVKCEPFERVQIDTPEEYMGSIIESLSNRKVKCKICNTMITDKFVLSS